MNDKIVNACETFITGLTGADKVKIEQYAAEITTDEQFRGAIEKNRILFKRKSSIGDYSVGQALGVALYAICRIKRPDNVVETGVASGVSSSFILCALEQNERGRLYSIDQPWWEEQTGWLVPDYLRHRWDLIPGTSSEKLPPLLKKTGEIDIFLHDSEHSYRNMTWEFHTTWRYLKTGGLLLSHNIDDNKAFTDFCREQGVKGYVLGKMGGLAKG